MRVIRGVLALIALVVGLIGVPTALVLLGGSPVPHPLTWEGVRRALFTPDDGSAVLGMIAVVAWLAWLVFTLSVVTEAVELASRNRIQLRLPGLGGSQRLASGLIISVLALVSLPQHGHADPVGTPRVETSGPDGPASHHGSEVAQREAAHQPAPPTNAARQQDAPGSIRHLVKRGDDLWSLAEHYYGDGPQWRKIAAANADVLTGGPDRLVPGWKLLVPGPHTAAPDVPAAVTVHKGDTLSSIAASVYGDADEWPTLYAANRAHIEDPDEVEPGLRIQVPADNEQAGQKTAGRTQKRDQSGTATVRSGAAQGDTPGPGEEPSKQSTAPSPTPPAPSRPAPTPPAPSRPAPSTAGPKSGASTSAAPSSAPSEAVPSSAEATSTVPGSAEATSTVPGSAEATSTVPGSAEPPSTVPSTGAPERTAPDSAAPRSPLPTEESLDSTTVAGLATVGGLLAAGVISTLAHRRRIQLQSRPVGRRILHPGAAGQAVESSLGKKQRPMSLRTLDLATRAVAAHSRNTSMPVPSLQMATVADDQIELIMDEPVAQAPVGFTVTGTCWRLDPDDADYLRSIPGVGEVPRPYPSLVSIGQDGSGAQRLVNLESVGLISLSSRDPDLVEAALLALAVELSNSAWAEEMVVTLLGTGIDLPDALGRHDVTCCDSVDDLLERLERRAAVQRHHDPKGQIGQHRVDPDLADSWMPEVVLVNKLLTADQGLRLLELTTTAPRVTIAAVVAGDLPGAPWWIDLDGADAAGSTGAGTAGATAILQPIGLPVSPQLIRQPAADALVDLLACTGSSDTDPAPWWHAATESPPEAPPVAGVRYLSTREDPRHGPNNTNTAIDIQRGRGTGMERTGGDASASHGPVLLLLGPIDLVGAAGPVPPRAARQCLEYCGWLLEHPGTTAQAMMSALLVAEGTRRSNMSRLRTWLGSGPDGEPYLPDAYTGRIALQPTVSSDWIQLRILTAAGIPNTSTQALRTALHLVRGAPLADAAPGQWHWAEELRTDMISAVRDIGVELTSRALVDHDIDLARWAAARALVAAPGDELLMRARISTEHQAGNRPEVERLTLQLAAQARFLGVDLDPDTVVLLQQMMEGQVRARLA